MNKEGQISEECYEALIEEFKKEMEEMTARAMAETKNNSVDIYEQFEVNKKFRDAIEELATNFEEPIERVLEKLENACNALIEQTGKVLENITLCYVESFKNIDELWNARPPAEIKKELKHERNPMRIKQLNRELNESCLFYKKKK